MTPESPVELVSARTYYLLIGLPGAGKSAWAAQQAGCVVVSRDEVRRFLYGNRLGQRDDEAVFREVLKLRVREGDADIVIDGCHAYRRERVGVVETIRCSETSLDYRVVGVLFDVAWDVCLARNEALEPEARVLVPDMQRLRAALRANDPKAEGIFDQVLVVRE